MPPASADSTTPGEKLLESLDGDNSLIRNYLRSRCPGSEPMLPVDAMHWSTIAGLF